MKSSLLLIVFFSLPLFSQTIWHVKPYGGNRDFVTTNNDGKTLNTAWTLQEAMTDYHKKIVPGDIVYLHGGTYKGHFTCNLKGLSWKRGKYITVKAYPGETAVIDGNNHENYSIPDGMHPEFILSVTGKYVHFEDFRVTCLGNFTRIVGNDKCNPKDNSFHGYAGIVHAPETVSPCRFINLVIDNIPGVAFSSWKDAADTEVYGCLMYYNGYINSTRKNCNDSWETHGGPNNPENATGIENCIYTQNRASNGKTRKFSNNIFLNNYKSGIAIWSAEKNPQFDYLSHFYVDRNIFVNNGSPIRSETPNMLIASDSRNGKNFAEDIDVVNNVFYFNTSNDISGITHIRNRNVRIKGNEFYNGTAAVELFVTNKKMTFTNNFFVGKRVKIFATPENFKGDGNMRDRWKMTNNTYFTTNPTNLFLTDFGGLSLDDFEKRYNTNLKSKVLTGNPIKKNIFRNAYNPNRFHLTYFNRAAATGTADFNFKPYKIPDGARYTIRDAEAYHNPIATGKYNAATGIISCPVSASPGFEMPRPSIESGKTAFVATPVHSKANFRVYIVTFDEK